MAENNSTASGGIGFFGALTLLFIGLKLGGVINWSWFWVLSPLIFSVGLVLFIFLIILIVFVVKDTNKRF